MISNPLRWKLPAELSNSSHAQSCADAANSHEQCPVRLAPTFRMSTANAGIIVMYAMPKKLLKNVIAIRKENIELPPMNLSPSQRCTNSAARRT